MAFNCPSESLPSHLLAIILCRLPAADFVRCGAVCGSWRRATADNPHRPSSPEVPCLIVPGSHQSLGKLFNLSTNNVSPLPIIGGQLCLGSSDGWVVTIDAFAELCTFNPFTSATAKLPSITTFSCIQGVRQNAGTGRIAGYTWKMDPGRNAQFCYLEDMCKLFFYKAVYFPSVKMVVTIHSFCKALSLARVGDDSWTELDPINNSMFSDFILHKGQLYVVSNRGCVSAFNLGNGDPSSPPTLTSNRSYPPILDSHHHYLMVSTDGDLLQVCRELIHVECQIAPDFQVTSGELVWNFRPNYWRTKSFKIFKLQPNGLRAEVTALAVKTAMFLGHNQSMMISTRGSPLKENHIYFTDSHYGSYFATPPSRRDIGVFNLEDGSIEPLFHTKPCLVTLLGHHQFG